jgi:hypothetical protein
MMEILEVGHWITVPPVLRRPQWALVLPIGATSSSAAGSALDDELSGC